MTTDEPKPRRISSPAAADTRLVAIEKGQNLGFHYPSTEDLAWARRILTGEMTPEEARAEIFAKYRESEE